LSWNFGNGQTATGSSVATNYSSNGTFTVTLTATRGGQTATATTTVSCGWVARGRNKTVSCSV
jgi:PKD repeat protein